MSWRDLAACKGIDPNTFFPADEDTARAVEALTICGYCPVRQECSDASDNIRFGVVAGEWRGRLRKPTTTLAQLVPPVPVSTRRRGAA